MLGGFLRGFLRGFLGGFLGGLIAGLQGNSGAVVIVGAEVFDETHVAAGLELNDFALGDDDFLEGFGVLGKARGAEANLENSEVTELDAVVLA